MPRPTLELRIVFDTNALHNQSASDFVRQEIAVLLAEHANHDDLVLRWYVPDSVRLERRYQMIQFALEMLPTLQKFERVIGIGLTVTEQIIESRIDAIISEQMAAMRVQLLMPNMTDIDWSRVMHDATARRPPFDRGEKEKGFRDLLVGESFLQLVKESPANSSKCRIVLLTADRRLTEMVSSRLGGRDNARVIPTVEELRGLINTLASDVGEEFVNRHRPAAKALFYTEDKTDTLWYSERLREQILTKFKGQIEAPPAGAAIVEQERWQLADPEFAKKKGQRTHWSSRFTIPLKAFRLETVPAVPAATTNVSGYPVTKSDFNFMSGGSDPKSLGFRRTMKLRGRRLEQT